MRLFYKEETFIEAQRGLGRNFMHLRGIMENVLLRVEEIRFIKRNLDLSLFFFAQIGCGTLCSSEGLFGIHLLVSISFHIPESMLVLPSFFSI